MHFSSQVAEVGYVASRATGHVTETERPVLFTRLRAQTAGRAQIHTRTSVRRTAVSVIRFKHENTYFKCRIFVLRVCNTSLYGRR